MAANKNKIVRTFLFMPDYVSCNSCAKNYNCQAAIEGRIERTFCQEFSMHRDPNDIGGNQKTAHKCLHWVPDRPTRAVMEPQTPEHERWYEKDSMA